MKALPLQRHHAADPTVSPAPASAGQLAAPEGSPRQRGQRERIAQLMAGPATAAPIEKANGAPVQLNRTAEKRRERQKANQSRRAERRERIQAERESAAAARTPRKRRPRKLEAQLPEISRSKRELYERLAEKDETSWGVRGRGLVLAKEGTKGPFDEDFGEDGALMWRSDTRAPRSVLKTGFTTKAERDLGPADTTDDGQPTGNEIVYRTGPEDIVPATGVCVARDVRGACFFPFKGAEHDSEAQEEAAYLYGVRVRQATNTYKAQQVAERHATGRQDWKDPSRFAYDPNDEHTDDASAVWPFAEYVTHRIAPEDIVAAYRFKRDRLVAPDKPGVEPKAGIGFSIAPRNLVKPSGDEARVDPLRETADLTAAAYSERYPRHPDHYISYQGTVRKTSKGHPTTDAEASTGARQIDALPSARPRPDLKKAARRRKLAEKKERKQRGQAKPKPRPGTKQPTGP
ncbi:hypothetical protein [Ideonella sp.]|uniref:hypothetical protein n=1 Tax=Ideonella sp. TaxID=1929293 RepID=UPI0035B00A2D